MDRIITIIGIIIAVAVVAVFFVLRRGSGYNRENEKPTNLRRRFRYKNGRPEQDKWVSTESFENEKKKLKPGCSAMEFSWFFSFLHNYKGGYIRREGGRIVSREYLNKEKGDLKGIFYNIVFPNPNIRIEDKEIFRGFLIELGVTGVEARPDYEGRDTKLKNRKEDPEEYKRKQVGNIGEQLVRDTLEELNPITEYGRKKLYTIINGPCFRHSGITKEFDHIVVGRKGVFVIETKAFGMTDGKAQRASLFIDPGDKWILRKNKSNKELETPTAQIMSEKEMLENMLERVVKTDIHPVLLCSNSELFIKNNIELPYAVIRVDGVLEHINAFPDTISDEDIRKILQIFDSFRIN